MPYLNFYADAKDLATIRKHFNEHPEVAYIVSNGPRRWRAEKSVPRLVANSTALWHVPSGSLPLVFQSSRKKDGRIRDPWKGWRASFSGADKSCPYFGPGHPGVIWFNPQPRAKHVRGGVGMSSFEWIGNWYGIVGSRAKKITEVFWKDLRRWVKENATLIPRKGRVNGPRREIWAFPSALASFKAGRGRDEDWF